MPVDGAGFRQQVGDLECDGVAFAPAQGGAGDDAIDGGCRAGKTVGASISRNLYPKIYGVGSIWTYLELETSV